MSETVIKIENLSKRYRLGKIGTGTLSHDLNRWLARMRGKEDPYSKVRKPTSLKVSDGDYIWALQGINIEIGKGEVLGIIGKNGAGKSTLLKILSRVTTPTSGAVYIKGRIASLLEVGTGFHPDLTGRENIYLNGAILGMTGREIKSKLDEIVDFSGVEVFVDTPVKRYSSGMYVRLAFAVAAHLEPEILVVDEVLAVGDAEFQKKCLGKMKDVSGQGRTVLFVSHNMSAVRSLCRQSILLKDGELAMKGNSEDIIAEYLKFSGFDESDEIITMISDDFTRAGTGYAKFTEASIVNSDGDFSNTFFFKEKFKVKLKLEVLSKQDDVTLTLGFLSDFGEKISLSILNESNYKTTSFEPGVYELEATVDMDLMPGRYSLFFSLVDFYTGRSVHTVSNFFNFKVGRESKDGNLEYPWMTVHGYSEPPSSWKIKKIE